MKNTGIAVLSALVVCMSISIALAGGDAEKGKALFNDPTAFGAPGETSCNSCHPDGMGLENAGAKDKKEWKTPAGTLPTLEEAINICITNANKGKAIDTKSEEMKDMVAYIKSLGMMK